MPNKPFGYSYHLDIWGCENTDNLEVVYRYLEKLVHLLGMNQCGSVYAIHGPVQFDESGQATDVYPGNAGISAFVPLIQSGISLHSVNPTKFITIDVYSCKQFNPIIVDDFTLETFKYTKSQSHWLERGTCYE